MHEQLAERRVLGVGAGVVENDLGVADQPDGTRVGTVIDERDAPELGIPGVRDGHLQALDQAVVVPLVAGGMGVKGNPRGFPGPLCGQMRDRPDVPGSLVTKVEPAAPVVPRGVRAPPGQGPAVPRAHPATGVGDEYPVAAVGQQMDLGGRRLSRNLPGGDVRHGTGMARRRCRFRARHGFRIRSAGSTLAQEQRTGLHPRFGGEAGDAIAPMQNIAHADQRHAVVVRHVALDDGTGGAHFHAPLGEVQCLVEAVMTEHAQRFQAPEVVHGRLWAPAHGEKRGVGRDHRVLVFAGRSQRQRWHPECVIGVVFGGVESVVAGFGDSPGHAGGRRVGHLRGNGGPGALAQKRGDGLVHE